MYLAPLEPEQDDLLVRMVEAQRSLPRQERQHFILARMAQGDELIHPRFRGEMLKTDLDALQMRGFVYVADVGGRGSLNFDITLEGHAYYEDIKRRAGEPVAQIESEVVRYLETEEFERLHPTAAAKWKEAAKTLWASEWEQELTNIGHRCREAIQSFADDLVTRYQPEDASPDRNKDINRIKAVIAQQRSRYGTRESEFLDACVTYLDGLLGYWRAVSALVQRQEHGTGDAEKPVGWQDARRVVFQTALVMYEVEQSLGKE